MDAPHMELQIELSIGVLDAPHVELQSPNYL